MSGAGSLCLLGGTERPSPSVRTGAPALFPRDGYIREHPSCSIYGGESEMDPFLARLRFRVDPALIGVLEYICIVDTAGSLVNIATGSTFWTNVTFISTNETQT